jgi:hypothetical protein
MYCGFMKITSSLVLAGFVLCGPLVAAPPPLPNPDFTKGEPIPDGATKDWNLGATGARGWIYSNKLSTTEARQVFVTKIAKGSPSDGMLQVGDVILGVAGKPFSHDPRQEMGKALTAAEAKDGKLALTRWRDGKAEEVVIPLQVLGSYSPTSPYDCEKSKRILEQSCEALAKRMEKADYKENAISRSLNALGLLASGDPKYLPILKKEAKWAAGYEEGGYQAWWYGYVSVFLSEYILATGDKSVLPGLRRIVMEASKGQSNVGSWGHRFAMPDGRLFGYGMMNSPGIPLTIGLVLAREAGVKDPEVATAIQRSGNLLRFFIGKGAVPYGDHAPFMQSHEDNGKCGMAAVLFDQLGDEKGARFFAKMSAASHGNERDQGHTGNFFNMAWAMPGVSRCGPQATGAWMEEFGSWYFDLARGWDGSFAHQGPPQARDDSYGKWDATGVYLIAYAMPLKAIRLTGKKPSTFPALSAETARQVVRDGRGFTGYSTFTAYDELPPDTLLELLGSWSPIVRARASGTFARRGDITVEPLLKLLDDPSIDARLGACEALAAYKEAAAPAVPKLREALRADDLWLRVKAAEALNAIGTPAMVAVPEMLKMAAKGPAEKDPRGMEQRFVVKALFNPRGGLLGKSLDGVDRELLYQAVRSGLRNEDGHARGAFSSVYANLSYDELRPLMPVIHRAILEKSPSGEMFDGQIQTAGLELLSKHRVSEGIELLADYVRLQKQHGSQKHIITLLKMFKPYGAHAQRAIPRLEKAIQYFEKEEKDFPRDMSMQKAEMVRETIKEIRAMKEKPELRKMSS